MEINECRACNPQCKDDCDKCLAEFEEFERQKDVRYSQVLAAAYENPEERKI